MSYYLPNINPYDFRNIKSLYVTEPTGSNRNHVLLKLELTGADFNFNLTQSSGQDFRLALSSNGNNVLQYWISRWDAENQAATIFYRIPFIAAGDTITLWAFWGNDSVVSKSSLSKLEESPSVFLLSDHFEIFDTSKWDPIGGRESVSNSYLSLGSNRNIDAKNTPLSGIRSWTLELKGIFSTETSSDQYNHRIFNIIFDSGVAGRNGAEIEFYVNEYDTNVYHNFIDAENFIEYSGPEMGLDKTVAAEHYIIMGYDEGLDSMFQGMYGRPNMSDYINYWERKVHRNTEIEYITIKGPDGLPGMFNLDWIILYDSTAETNLVVDKSDLYIPFEYVPYQEYDPIEYLSDATSLDYYHTTDTNCDPYKLSDNILDSIGGAFSCETSSGYVIIDFVRPTENLVRDYYIHFDNNHLVFYNASKLSNDNDDPNGRNHWQAAVSSNVWASIQFPDPQKVKVLSVQAVPELLGGMIKDYEFYVSSEDPRFNTDWELVHAGTFELTEAEQTVYIQHPKTFRYYILKALSTYGGNVALQSWRMYSDISGYGSKSIAQLRLRPLIGSSNEDYFPKYIKFYGSNNLTDWTTLLPIRKTYTPYEAHETYGYWQRYSFDNDDSYAAYKLEFNDNWSGQNDKIVIAEWEMVEKASELNTYRILDGHLNNVDEIWGKIDTDFDGGVVYLLVGESASEIEEAETTIVVYAGSDQRKSMVSASSEYGSTLLAEYVFDGVISSDPVENWMPGWWTEGVDPPPWLQWDFGEDKYFDEFRMARPPDSPGYYENFPKYMEIYVSDTGNFSGEQVFIGSAINADVGKGTYSSWHRFSDPRSARYLRIEIHTKWVDPGSSEQTVKVAEVEFRTLFTTEDTTTNTSDYTLNVVYNDQLYLSDTISGTVLDIEE